MIVLNTSYSDFLKAIRDLVGMLFGMLVRTSIPVVAFAAQVKLAGDLSPRVFGWLCVVLERRLRWRTPLGNIVSERTTVAVLANTDRKVATRPVIHRFDC